MQPDHGAEHLPCIDVVELLSDYLEGDLDPALAARVEAHLDECPPCVVYLEQLRLTIRSLGLVPTPSLQPAVVDALNEVFRDLYPHPDV